jgi:hypothetical protein
MGEGHSSRVSCLGMASDGSALCTGSWDTSLKVSMLFQRTKSFTVFSNSISVTFELSYWEVFFITCMWMLQVWAYAGNRTIR